MTIDKVSLRGLIAEAKVFVPGEDRHDFDTRLAEALGFETPNEYAERKAAESDAPMQFNALDPYSVGRKLVAMLGEGWSWGAVDEGISGTATVTGPNGENFTAKHRVPEMALRLAALKALEK